MNLEYCENLKKSAKLMSSLDPWKKFNYSVEECFIKLAHPEIKLLFKFDEQGSIKGFVAFSNTGIFFPLISYLCIAERYQRKGIGLKLLQQAENYLFQDSKNILLTVSDFNTSAIPFYLHAGYVQVGKLENYNFTNQAELIFRKTLGPKREK